MPKLLRVWLPRFIFLLTISYFFPLLFWCSTFSHFHFFFIFLWQQGTGCFNRTRNWGHPFIHRTRGSQGLARQLFPSHSARDLQPCTCKKRKLNPVFFLTYCFITAFSVKLQAPKYSRQLSPSLPAGQPRWLLSPPFPRKSNKEGHLLHKSCCSLAWQ